MTEQPCFSASDLAYVGAEYRTLEELCADRAETADQIRDLIDAGRLPRPTYVLPGGFELFPPDYFALLDDAGGIAALPGHFHARHVAASGSSEQATADWQGYLTGRFGVCLRSVTPEVMAEKTRLIAAIELLLDAPVETSERWCATLRHNVGALDALERPFTDYDRRRWGDTSRDRYITRVQQRYPEVFAASTLA